MTEFFAKGKFNCIIDGQFGSTGKGLYSGYMAKRDTFDLAVTNAAPNAGHTYIDRERSFICFHLPVSGVLNEKSKIFLSAGSIIDPELLIKEITELKVNPERIYIHPRAAIILPMHRHSEKHRDSAATKLASTQKGVGAALADKVKRSGILAGDFFPNFPDKNTPNFSIADVDLNLKMKQGSTVFMEIPQGVDLGLNGGLSYPYCTSREVSVAQGMSDAGVHPSFLGNVHMTLRTYPIRVGNIVDEEGKEIGTSGPFYPDSVEKTWDDLQLGPERTTVTKRVRRVATFSEIQYHRSLTCVRPASIFLNFANYCEQEELLNLLRKISAVNHEEQINPDIYLGTGPKEANVKPYVTGGTIAKPPGGVEDTTSATPIAPRVSRPGRDATSGESDHIETPAPIRREVMMLAHAMEHKLRKNDHKGGWEERNVDVLFKRLLDEVDELKDAIRGGNFIEIFLEAADVANFAMMIAWNVMKGKLL
jgi:adenylosuccinate synthase